MTVRFKIFHRQSNWEKLCEEAAAFATGITPDRLIGISHSQDATTLIVTVWYWERDQTPG
jgi:hypothetical protein